MQPLPASMRRVPVSAGVEEVLRWVRRCWASLYDPAAVAYRREHGFSEARAAMAVIVQRLIPAEVAGVAYTVDPGQRPA